MLLLADKIPYDSKEIIVYTRRQIKKDQPGSYDFWRFSRKISTDFLEILQRSFSIEILIAVKYVVI